MTSVLYAVCDAHRNDILCPNYIQIPERRSPLCSVLTVLHVRVYREIYIPLFNRFQPINLMTQSSIPKKSIDTP